MRMFVFCLPSSLSLYPPSLDPGYLYDSAEDLLPSEDSGSSVGVGPGALETSVDADLTDDEYMDQINQRVFSPVDEGGLECSLNSLQYISL